MLKGVRYLFLWPIKNFKKEKKKRTSARATVQQRPTLSFVIETAEVRTASEWETPPAELGSSLLFRQGLKEQVSALISLNTTLRKGAIGETHFLVSCRRLYKSYCSLPNHPAPCWTTSFSVRKVWTFICCGEGKHNLPLQRRKDFDLSDPDDSENNWYPTHWYPLPQILWFKGKMIEIREVFCRLLGISLTCKWCSCYSKEVVNLCTISQKIIVRYPYKNYLVFPICYEIQPSLWMSHFIFEKPTN